MGPIDYSLNVASPFQAALQGYQAGSAIRADQLQQQQQEAALKQQQDLRAAYAALASNPAPTAADYSKLMLLDPKSAESIQRAWTARNQEQQQTLASDLGQYGAALINGKPELVAQMLSDKADAMEATNKGPTPESQSTRVLAQVAKENPQLALGKVIAMLQAGGDAGKSVAEGLMKLQTQPAAVRKANAEATSAEVAAKYAEPAAVTDLQKKGWDIEAIKGDLDYKRQMARIAAMNASISRESNDLKRQELQLKVQEAQQSLDEKVRTRAADAESAASNIDNALNTIERIKKNPKLDSVVGSIEGRLPAGFSDEANDAVALIETLGSQAFLAQIPSMKGQGALSNAEGEKLQSALTNLSRAQSEKQFRANLDEAERLWKKARENIAKRSGMPLGKPDTPAAPGARPPLDSFFTQ